MPDEQQIAGPDVELTAAAEVEHADPEPQDEDAMMTAAGFRKVHGLWVR